MSNSGSSVPGRPQLSVVIPACNEEMRLPGTLEDVLRYLTRQSFRSEIIVVDDGSSDGTVKAARSFCGGTVPVRICAHPDSANHGKGASVRMGMLQSRGEFCLFMDADNSTTVDQIADFWPAFDRGFDVIVGSRKAPGAHVLVHQRWYKEVAGRFGNLVIRSLAVPGVSDTQAGFKMFTRECVETVFPQLTIDRWGMDIEILAVARFLNFRICEMPITWINSPSSKVGVLSYFQVLSDVWRVHRNLRSGVYRRG